MGTTANMGSHFAPAPAVNIRVVGSDCPRKWVDSAWDEIKKAPRVSLIFGGIVALAGFALLWVVSDAPQLIVTFITGFLFVSPFLAVGLYDLSNHLEHGEEALLSRALMAWKKKVGSIVLLGMIPTILMIAWARVTSVMVAIFFSGEVMMDHSTLLASLLTSEAGIAFLLAYMCVGAMVASFLYAMLAVSIPLCFDRDIDPVSAAIISFNTVMKNFTVMAKWAAVIVLYTAIGFISFGVAFLVVVPLLGYGTWHAYEDLIE